MPSGREGIRYTLAAMRKFVDQGKTDPVIRQLSTALISDLNQKDYRGEVERLYDYVKFRVRYVRDINGVEMVQTPRKTLELASGDCDDKATLLAAMLESIGFKTRFRAVGFGHGICHVMLTAMVDGEWLNLDTTEPYAMGWAPLGIVEEEYMSGFFSDAVKKLSPKNITKKHIEATKKAVAKTKAAPSKIVSASKKLTMAPVKATLTTVKGGDPTKATKTSLVESWRGAHEIHKATTSDEVLRLEVGATQAVSKVLNSKFGEVLTAILSFIPVTAPFAWGIAVARIVSVGEEQRRKMSLAYKKAGKNAKREQLEFNKVIANARYVYDPGLQAIRLRKKSGDENLPEYKMDTSTQRLIMVNEGKINTDVSAPAMATNGPITDEYGNTIEVSDVSDIDTSSTVESPITKVADKASTAKTLLTVATVATLLLG